MHIHFHGAAGEVTGSCFLLECGRHQVLVDCGMVQGSRKEEARNAQPFPFDPARLDAVVLTHAHLDHSGRLPLLVKAGFRGKIYTHRASRDLCRIMLLDAAFIAEKDAELDSRKLARKGLPPVEPLYTREDAEHALTHFRGVDYGDEIEIAPGIRLRLTDAGHILGSAIAEIWLQEGHLKRKLVFSGDLGHSGAPIMRDPATVAEADLVIMESTYGEREHRSWQATWDELAAVFAEANASRGNILIPAFAVGRTQELLYLFRKHYHDWGIDRWQVFLDSPMAIQATEVYAKHRALFDRDAAATLGKGEETFSLPNLTLSETANDSMALNRFRSGAMIIAGSGMCDGGRIRHHLKHNLWRPETQIVIVGYQAQGTLGRALVDGVPYVRMWGEQIRVAAKIHTVGGLSAHAGQSGLLDWYGAFTDRPPLALVHGEDSPRETLAAKIEERFGVEARLPELGESWDLAALHR